MKRSSRTCLAVGSLFLSAAACVLAFPPAGGYHLLKKIPFGAAEGGGEYFDYITFDATARRVYLSHGTEVKVLDADSWAPVGNITGLKRSHGVALVPELGRGFISDGDLAQAVIFDLKTLKTTGQVKAEADADSILYEPVSKGIFFLKGGPNRLSLIPPPQGAGAAPSPLGRPPGA